MQETAVEKYTPFDIMITMSEDATSIPPEVLLIHSPEEHILPKSDWFERQFAVPEQRRFGSGVKHVVLVPIRAELHNRNFLHFLRELNQQKGLRQDEKIGVVLLLNDHVIDDKRQILKDEGLMDLSTAVPENRLTAQFLSHLVVGNLKAIEELEIEQEYKDVAKELLDPIKGRIVLRFDYISKARGPHLGRLRLHLLNLMDSFRAKDSDSAKMISHFMDIDVGLSPVHLARLHKYFAEPSHEVNISDWDLNPDGEENSRDLLLTSDQFRAYMGLCQLQSVLESKYNSGSPTISGRLSALQDPEIARILLSTPTGEDFQLGKYFRKKYGSHLGHESEVYFVDRARPSMSSKFDAESRWNFKANGGLSKVIAEYNPANSHMHLTTPDSQIRQEEPATNLVRFNLGQQLSDYINFLEVEIQRKYPALHVHEELQAIMQDEVRREAAKVKLRRQRLGIVISAMVVGKDPREVLPEHEYRIVKPYIDAFPEEWLHINQNHSISAMQHMHRIMEKYPSFFHFEDPLHQQMARIRGLIQYCAERDIFLTQE